MGSIRGLCVRVFGNGFNLGMGEEMKHPKQAAHSALGLAAIVFLGWILILIVKKIYSEFGYSGLFVLVGSVIAVITIISFVIDITKADEVDGERLGQVDREIDRSEFMRDVEIERELAG